MKKFILTLLLNVVILSTFAQATTPSAYAQRKFFDSTSYVLPLLTRAAITNAPEMKRQLALKKIADIDLNLSKNEILKQFYVNGNYNYGSTPNSISGVQSSQFNAFNQKATALYLVGINLNISLEQITGGIKKRVDKQKLVVEETAEGGKAEESTIRVKMITLYRTLVLSKILYDHAEDALQTATVNKSLVDKQFKSQEVKITDQMASNDLHSRAVAEKEQAKSNYQLNVMLLEEAIGMPINQFILDYVK